MPASRTSRRQANISIRASISRQLHDRCDPGEDGSWRLPFAGRFLSFPNRSRCESGQSGSRIASRNKFVESTHRQPFGGFMRGHGVATSMRRAMLRGSEFGYELPICGAAARANGRWRSHRDEIALARGHISLVARPAAARLMTAPS
jgi:hypothetical protein